MIIASAQVHGDTVQDAFRALLTETLRFRYEEVEPSELAKAKTIIKSDAVYQRETMQGIARKLGHYELVAGGAEFEQTYREQVAAVTAADVLAVARKYLTPDVFSVSALMPNAKGDALDLPTVKRLGGEVAEALEAAYRAPPVTEAGELGVTKVLLENGATLMVLPDPTVPLVSIRTASVGGLLAETAENNGVTYLMGELLVKGTEKYPYAQIVEEVDAMAGGLNGVAGRNSVGLRGDFLAESWPRGFELFASCLLEPVFASEETRKRSTDPAGRHRLSAGQPVGGRVRSPARDTLLEPPIQNARGRYGCVRARSFARRIDPPVS